MKILLDSENNLSVRHNHQTDASLKLQRRKSKKKAGRGKGTTTIMKKGLLQNECDYFASNTVSLNVNACSNVVTL